VTGDLANEPVRPFPKSVQTATRTKKHARPRATAGRWAGIVAEKQGPCVILGCGHPAPNDMHHAVPRDYQGPDVPENIVPVCRHHHRLLEVRDADTCRLFVESLWYEAAAPGSRGGCRDTYSWAVDTFGETIFERVYGIRYERTSA